MLVSAIMLTVRVFGVELEAIFLKSHVNTPAFMAHPLTDGESVQVKPAGNVSVIRVSKEVAFAVAFGGLLVRTIV